VTSHILDDNGSLITELTPAVYFDASVLIDYWMTEGMEIERGSDLLSDDLLHDELVRKLLNANKRMAGMVDVRKKLVLGEPATCVATSTLAMLELFEWHAGSALKNIAAKAAGVNAIQRMGNKSFGELLNCIYSNYHAEAASADTEGGRTSTPLQQLVSETMVNRGFAEAHGFSSVLVADVRGFDFTEEDAWDVSELLSYLQMGMADIVHLLVARHLGCKWVASFDSDFQRCRNHIRDGLGLELLSSPEDILGVIKTG